MTDRFDLEQNILESWRITSDIKDLISKFDCLTIDQQVNYLIGLEEIYNIKFEKLWDSFESCIQKKEFKPTKTLDEIYDEPNICDGY